MKRIITVAIATLLLVSLTLVGCSNNGASSAKAPKEVLQEAFTKSTEITSSKFEGTMKLNLELPESEMADPETAMVLNILNNAELTMRGTSQLDPMISELFLTARVTGDTEMAINLSMLITEEKMWVKIPNIPFFPLPEEIVGKYLELDFAELSELSGEEIQMVDQQKYQQLGIEIAELFFGAFDDEYFVNVSAEDSNLPEDVNADQVVKFELTNENLRPVVETLYDVLPQIIEKVAELEEAAVTQEEIDQIKAELEAGKADLDEGLDEVEEMVNINEGSFVTAIDNNGFITYADMNVNLDITAEGETGTIGMYFALKQFEINEEPAFELTEPDASEILPFEDLMMGLMYSGF